MLTIKQSIKLSAILDKMNLEIKPKMMEDTDGKKREETAQELGVRVLMEVAKNAHRAEQDIYEFVALCKGCTKKEAENLDLMEVIGELSGKGLADFFKPAQG